MSADNLIFLDNHLDDPRTCPECKCTRLTFYVNRKRKQTEDGHTYVPVDPVYVCQTPICDEFDGVDVTGIIDFDSTPHCDEPNCGRKLGEHITTRTNAEGCEVDTAVTTAAFVMPDGKLLCEDCEADWALDLSSEPDCLF